MIRNSERVSQQILRSLNNLMYLHYSPCFGYFDDSKQKLEVGHLIEIPVDELPPQTVVVLLHTLRVMKKLNFEYGMFSGTWLVVEKMSPPLKLCIEIDTDHVIVFDIEYLPRLIDFHNSQALDYVEYNFEYKMPDFKDQHLASILGDMNDYIAENMNLFELKPKSLCDWYYRIATNQSYHCPRNTSSKSLCIMQRDDYELISTKLSARVSAQDNVFDFLVREMKMDTFNGVDNWKRIHSEMYYFIVAYLEPRHKELQLNLKLKCWYQTIAFLWTFPSFQHMSWETKNKLYEITIDCIMDKTPNILMKMFNHKEHYDKHRQVKLLQKMVENPVLVN